MARTSPITVNITTTEEVYRPAADIKTAPGVYAEAVTSLILGIAAGDRFGTIDVQDTSTGQASGTLTLSTASGTVGGTINGVTVTVTASGGDTATAAAIATAINASGNALVNQCVTATSAGAVVTLKCKLSGPAGNWVTLVASGTGVTASGARLTGGAASANAFTI